MKIVGSLRAVWITISALALPCESQAGPGLVVIHYNGYELPSKSSWAGLCSPWASVGNRLFCAPLAKLSPKAKPRPAAHGRVVRGRGSRTQTPSARPDGAILRAVARREAMPLRQQYLAPK